MKKWLLFLLISFPISGLMAQEDQGIIPAEIRYRTLVNTPLTLPKGYMVFEGTISSVLINSLFDDKSSRYVVPQNVWAKGRSYYFYYSYGLTNRWQFEISSGYRNERVTGSTRFELPGNFLTIDQTSQFTIVGLADTDLSGYYQLIPEDIMGSGLVGVIRFTIPTGTKGIIDYNYTDSFVSWKEGTGSGVSSIAGGLRYRKVFFPFSTDIFIDYKYGFSGEKEFYSGDNTVYEFQGSSSIALTGNFNVQLNDWIAIKQSLYFSNIRPEYVLSEEPGKANIFLYTPFVSFQIKSFRITQAFSIPIKGKNINADNSYTVILRYIL